MKSARKAETAQENGRKSRGPTSEVGKQRSAQNASLERFAAKFLPPAEDERDQVEWIMEHLTQDLQPRGAMQEILVERMATLTWKLRRMAEAEQAIFAVQEDRLMQARERSLHEIRANKFSAKLHGYKLDESPYEQNHRAQTLERQNADVGVNQMLASSFLDKGRALERLAAYEFKLQKALEAALREFRQLQKHSREEAAKRATDDENDSSAIHSADHRTKIQTPDERRITRMIDGPNVLIELEKFLAKCHTAQERVEHSDKELESQNSQAEESPTPQSDLRSSASICGSNPDFDPISDDAGRFVSGQSPLDASRAHVRMGEGRGEGSASNLDPLAVKEEPSPLPSPGLPGEGESTSVGFARSEAEKNIQNEPNVKTGNLDDSSAIRPETGQGET